MKGKTTPANGKNSRSASYGKNNSIGTGGPLYEKNGKVVQTDFPKPAFPMGSGVVGTEVAASVMVWYGMVWYKC